MHNESWVVISLFARKHNPKLSTLHLWTNTQLCNIILKEDNLKDMLPIHFSKSSHCYKGYLLRHTLFWGGWGFSGKLPLLNLTLVLAMYRGASWERMKWNPLMEVEMGGVFFIAPCPLHEDPLKEFLSKVFLLFLSPVKSGLNLCLPLINVGQDIMTCVNFCPGFISISYLLSLLICPSFCFIFWNCMYFVTLWRARV